jgi:hypothetical protein
METEILKNQIVSRNGGKRPGAGRRKGGKNKATLEKKIIEEELRQRILKSAHKLLNSQMNLAEGCQYLYKIETKRVKLGNGQVKEEKQKPKLVTSLFEIEEYLSGENDNPDKYFYVTTERPDNKALENLFDRAMGKIPQPLQGTGENGELLIKISQDV